MQRAVGMHGNFITKVGDYSTGAGQTILPYVVQQKSTLREPLGRRYWTTLIILWANDPVKNLQVGWNYQSFPYFEQLKEKVAKGEIKVVSIDPVKQNSTLFAKFSLIYQPNDRCSIYARGLSCSIQRRII